MEDRLSKIYSKRSVLGFSIFFSTLFGGVMLYKNLIETKKKTEAYTVLGFSVILTTVQVIVGMMLDNPKSSYAYLWGFVGGYILANYFFPKYFPNEEQYHKKSIWIPLIIGILLSAVFIALIIYGGSIESQ
ncbi:hypothetical protein [Chryseobacterium takakiae]|jgi:hypothetical protein|uniref:Uncharacterized protein n=1 Tax=Chryseobacterium takakiae TaxID=1302685 RepID=A0A1M4SU44_9FLAO|nr:hypothetical protein [Chryseobacterium takakiae]SHE35711.1 hypothetical protein SAMN05444408_10145 [Chryseobacterium takakiae]